MLLPHSTLLLSLHCLSTLVAEHFGFTLYSAGTVLLLYYICLIAAYDAYDATVMEWDRF